MGRIVASVTISNVSDPDARIRCDALVDTGANVTVLPTAWRDRLGDLDEMGTFDVALANQEIVQGTVFGPVRIQVEGFRPVYDEVIFVDMKPANGDYEPLVGCVVLEKIPAAVDMLGHRLVPVRALDLK
jgi:predicted aspartyl protease